MKDLIIIGAGPAGLAASLYASRAGLDVLILDAGAPGGKLNVIADIENWPGNKTVSGPDLGYSMYEHALQFGAVQEYGNVVDIKNFDDHKEVILDDGTIHKSKTVLIASGTKEKKMGLKKEDDLVGRGISYCAVCDAPFFKDEEVAVVGGGNSAIKESLHLAKFASKVHIILRRNEFRATKIEQDKACKNEKIEIHYNNIPLEIIDENNLVKGLKIEDVNTKQETILNVKGIFPFIGLIPVTDFAINLGIVDEKGYIHTNENMETSVEGVYAAGDVRDKFLRQVITASNDGAIAGQAIFDYLHNKI